MELGQENKVEQKFPVFLKIVTIIGFVACGLIIFNNFSALFGPLSEDQLDAQIMAMKQMANQTSGVLKEFVRGQIEVMRMMEDKYIFAKLIPLICAIVTLIGNFLLRKQKLVGMHLIIASVLGGFISMTVALFDSDFGIITSISSYLVMFAYTIMVIINRKHLS